MRSQLAAELYKSAPKNLIQVSEFVSVSDAEIEDLIPFTVLQPLLDRMLRDGAEVFADHHGPAKPIVPQIEGFANRNGITLEPGRKVTLAKQFKSRMLSKNAPGIGKTDQEPWRKLYKRLAV
jgi:hypothetical protein